MSKNTNLSDAKRNKQDEFYTPLSEIENELRHYREQFKGKTVLCNCDDPYESNFFKYFAMNFNSLGLKKLISTCYDGSPVAFTQLSLFDGDEAPVELQRKPYKVEITEVKDWNGDGRVDLVDVEYIIRNGHNTLSIMEGDGDFRSPECLALLDEADIVVTNPPFSLFREFIDTVIEHGKQFIVLGSQNAITYKNVFPLLKENKMWMGFNSGSMFFIVPSSYSKKENIKYDENGVGWVKLGNVCWFTNMEHSKRHEKLITFRNYDPKDYPKYDNYDAIEVGKVADIPCDYDGAMGVPITYMLKHNPDQFEVMGILAGNENADCLKLLQTKVDDKFPKIARMNGKCMYSRILIRRKK